LKVLFLQDHFSTGGAARAANRFASGLRKQGVQVAVAAGDLAGSPEDYLITGKPKRGWGRVREFLQDADSKKKARQNRAIHAWTEAIHDFRPDLIWIHNLQGACKWGWNLAMVNQAMSSAPVLWTLHDMWALGDGPSYFSEKELPMRRGKSALASLSPAIKRGPHMLLTPSMWLRNLVLSVDVGPCETWANPLDLETFHPRSREKTRLELGLREGEILLLAAAENLSDPRKGISLLADAWKRIRLRDHVRLALVGRNCPGVLVEDPKVVTLGPVAAETRVAELMSAADLFLHPARMESYGLVLEEALACGTPVLAGAGSGMSEVMQGNPTGWPLHDWTEMHLASLLEKILADPRHLRSVRPAAREAMEQKHSTEKFLSRWNLLLNSLEQLKSGDRASNHTKKLSAGPAKSGLNS